MPGLLGGSGKSDLDPNLLMNVLVMSYLRHLCAFLETSHYLKLELLAKIIVPLQPEESGWPPHMACMYLSL
jgi:hypothetical protein